MWFKSVFVGTVDLFYHAESTVPTPKDAVGHVKAPESVKPPKSVKPHLSVQFQSSK